MRTHKSTILFFEVDGFLLVDGIRVKFPPHIGASLAAVARPGQMVKVIGFTGLPTQFGAAIEGLSVTSAATGKTVIDQPPTGYETRPSVAGQWLSVTGGVARFLVNPAGSVDGLIMASGEQVKLPPPAREKLSRSRSTRPGISSYSTAVPS